MANENLDVKISLKDDLSKGVGKIKTNFVDLAAKVFVAQQAFNAAVGVVRTFTDAASRQEDAINKLNTQLKINGSFTEETSKSLQEFAAQMQQVTRFGDEQIIQQTAFAMAMGATAEQAKRIIQVAADMSASLNIDLNAAVRNTAKTLGGFAGELGEVIPELKDLTTEQLRAGEGIDILASKFGGAAQQDVQTYSGSVEQLSNNFGDFKENIGKFITTSETGLGIINSLNVAFTFWNDVIGKANVATEAQKGVLGSLNNQLENLNTLIDENLKRQSAPLLLNRNQVEQEYNDLLIHRSRVLLAINDQQSRQAQLEIEKNLNLPSPEDENAKAEQQLEEKIARIQREKEMIALLDDDELNRKIQRFEIEKLAQMDLEQAKTQMTIEESKIRVKAEEEAQKKKNQAIQNSYNSVISLLELFGQESEKTKKALKVIRIAEAIFNTHAAATNALNSVPFPFNLGAYAVTLAQGLTSVSQIKAARFGADQIVTSPQMFMAGESGRPERVTVEPLGSRSGSSGGNTINIYMDSPSFNSENDANSIGEMLGFKIENALRLAR